MKDKEERTTKIDITCVLNERKRHRKKRNVFGRKEK